TPDHLLSADSLTIAARSGRTAEADEARREVVVDDPAGLHRGVHGRRSDEPKARFPQRFREGGRLRRGRLPVLLRLRDVMLLRPEGQEELVQRRRVAQRNRRASVRDRRLDLAAMPDDSRVPEQPRDVAFAEARDPVWIEAGECGAEALALAQDRQP